MGRCVHLLQGLLFGALACSGEVGRRVGDASALLQATLEVPAPAEKEASQPGAPDEEEDPDLDEGMDEAEAAAAAEAEAAYAQDTSGSFELGSTVFVNNQQGTIVWDGRPEHEFVKLKWLSGKEKGKTSEIIPVSQVKTTGPNATAVVTLAAGRHLSRHTEGNNVKKKAPKVKDFTRRRRGVIRRVVYGIKHMPMVMSIPFKGLHTGVSTITSEMTAHTGVAFNGSITKLLRIGEGDELLQKAEAREKVTAASAIPPPVTLPPKPKVNLREIIRNKTFNAVMRAKDKSLSPILNSFNSELQ